MTEGQNGNVLKKYFTTEIKFILWVAVFVRWIAVPYFGIREDIAIIKENHMAHIENFAKEMTRLSEVQTRQWDMMIELMKEISKIQ